MIKNSSHNLLQQKLLAAFLSLALLSSFAYRVQAQLRPHRPPR
jgi:hypothetical protein